MLFDTHCHVHDEAYNEDRDAVIQRAFQSGVQYMMFPGTDIPTSAAAVELARRYEGVYAAVGIHPEEAAEITDEAFAQIRYWITHEPKVVALGKSG